jgi:hypothetical protein
MTTLRFRPTAAGRRFLLLKILGELQQTDAAQSIIVWFEELERRVPVP